MCLPKTQHAYSVYVDLGLARRKKKNIFFSHYPASNSKLKYASNSSLLALGLFIYILSLPKTPQGYSAYVGLVPARRRKM